MKTKLIIIQLILFPQLLGCSNPNKLYFLEALEKTNKIYLYKKIEKEFCPIKSFTFSETKKLIENIKTDFDIEWQKEFSGEYKFELFSEDSLIGTLKVDYSDHPFVNFNHRGRTLGFRLNDSLHQFIKEIDANIYADCSKKITITNRQYYNEYKWLQFENITVMDFVELLPVKKMAPNFIYMRTTTGQADTSWITKRDIAKLIEYIDSEQPAYCIKRVVSSKLPLGEESTLGGQVMNIIDAYRLNIPYPYVLTDCSKTDKERKKQILNWWKDVSK